jgi:hemoglobin
MQISNSNSKSLDSIYAQAGEAAFYKLVEEFYKGVEADPLLRPIYPEDLAPGKEKLALYLIYRTGGPTTYTDRQGHPRMRARHMPFKIGQAERDAWMKNMLAALDATPELAAHKEVLTEFFDGLATFMINQPG